eukprot:CAMPEP_0168336430 /NCGR_PEP_ID=MMETSP0213-20121227/11537_1 /TAXON_ID=151035 /ORGANISM="Euplotes harpa, Strain FSP1.4" /LENGTH=55 /DNA_ID=CAMNT_0008341621 /DNA_START=333 /DNA_END=500 /DNA_ORIENTATION=+
MFLKKHKPYLKKAMYVAKNKHDLSTFLPSLRKNRRGLFLKSLYWNINVGTEWIGR